MNYFKDCNTLDDAKNTFRKLCFTCHPDTGGTHAEFIELRKQFKNFRPTTEHARKEDNNFDHDAFYNIVKRFEGLQNTLVSFVGSFIWLEDEDGHEGSTRAQKETIKSILIEGMNPPRFAGKRKKWFYSPLGYKQKFSSKKTFEEIKNTWGHKTYQANQKPIQRQIA